MTDRLDILSEHGLNIYHSSHRMQSNITTNYSLQNDNKVDSTPLSIRMNIAVKAFMEVGFIRSGLFDTALGLKSTSETGG